MTKRDATRRSPGRAITLVAAAIALAGCEGRPRDDARSSGPAEPRTGPAVVELDLTRGDPEQAAASLFGPSHQRTHLDLVRWLERLGDDEDARGVVVRLGAGGGIGFARAHELGRRLGALRDHGKPVVCHADEYDHATLLLASLGCSRLWVSPAGGVDAVGVAAELVFAKRLLDKLDVDVDFLQVGKFKGASEPFTRESASPEARASLKRALVGISSAWLDGVVAGRRRDDVRGSLEDGPFAPDEAKARGLVDEVGYLDDARDDAKKAAGAPRLAQSSEVGGAAGSDGLLDVFRAIAGAEQHGVPHVAVVTAIGAISMGGSPSILGDGEGIAEAELGRTLERLAKDESVKAVVVRIDSPGGSALASDLLWKRLMDVRAKKPLVFSIGGMAASGGYYMACTATKIVAEPTSILGSIGVVGGKFGVARPLRTLGVDVETVAATDDPQKAARAAYMSMFQTWDEPTRQRMLASMTAIYDLFLRRVAEGRGLPADRVAASAEGQIFGGVEAKERGLVDELGGLGEALALARSLAELPDDAPVESVGGADGLLDLLAGGADPGAAEGASAARREVGARFERTAIEALAPGLDALAPELRRLVASALPMVTGERAVAALPFAIVLH
jgi:protease-4